MHRLDRRFAVEGAVAGEHLVEDRAQREEVGAGVGGETPHLLRRHVPIRADHHAGPRLGERPRRRQLVAGALGADELGDPEVEDLGPPVAGQEQVLRLEVAVDDAALVRRRQAARHRGGDLRRPPRRQRPAGEPRPQGLALQQLGHQIRRAVVAADVVHGEDGGVVERRDGARLGLEAAQAVGAGRQVRRQHLDRDLAAEPLVARAVDDPHAAGPDGREDLVRPQTGAGLDKHGGERILSPCRPSSSPACAGSNRRPSPTPRSSSRGTRSCASAPPASAARTSTSTAASRPASTPAPSWGTSSPARSSRRAGPSSASAPATSSSAPSPRAAAPASTAARG